MKRRQQVRSILEGALVAWLVCLLLSYGLMKVVDHQFLPRMPSLDEPAHALDGYQIAWAFHAFSRRLEVLTGLVEVLCAVLLFFPRTRNLGALVTLGATGYITVLNLEYAIGMLVRSAAMFAAAALLVLLHFGELKAFFWDHAAPPRSPADLWPPWLQRAGRAFMSVVFGFGLLDYWLMHQALTGQRQPSEVWGRYRIESVSATAGPRETALLASGTIVYLDYRGEAGLRRHDVLRLGQYHVDPGAKRIEITLYKADAAYLHELHRTDGLAAQTFFAPETLCCISRELTNSLLLVTWSLWLHSPLVWWFASRGKNSTGQTSIAFSRGNRQDSSQFVRRRVRYVDANQRPAIGLTTSGRTCRRRCRGRRPL